MQAAISQFRANMLRVRNLGSIVSALNSQTTQALNLSDILRAEIVLAVSTLDQFVHEIVRLGMLDAYRGGRPRTEHFLRFRVSLGSALIAIESADGEQWIEDQVRIRNSYQSFQTPDKIADAIRLISNARLWDEVSRHVGTSSQEVRDRLYLIVNRRNQIAHEADIISPPYEELWPIDQVMVTSTVDFIEEIAEAIYLSVR